MGVNEAIDVAVTALERLQTMEAAVRAAERLLGTAGRYGNGDDITDGRKRDRETLNAAMRLLGGGSMTGWIHEDELPDSYPYDRGFPNSRVVDGVRMFPAMTDGPEPITTEWLESVGFEDGQPDQGYVYYVRQTRCGLLCIYCCNGIGDGTASVTAQGGGEVEFDCVHTRDDVRALVRMLGGELSENNESEEAT